jgi:hypothetical protein
MFWVMPWEEGVAAVRQLSGLECLLHAAGAFDDTTPIIELTMMKPRTSAAARGCLFRSRSS